MLMKTTCFTGALCLLLTACQPKVDYDVDGPTVGAQDFSVIEGDWVGTLTYTDYGSGELTVIATKSIVTSVSDTKIKYTISYPDKPWEDSKSNVNFYYGIAAIKAYQALGEQEKAQALIDELISSIEANPTVTYHDSAIHDASLYALSGQAEAAISILEEWVNRGGATSLLQQDIRHGLSGLADDPRYESILQTVNDRLSEQKANLARWEASGEMPPIPGEVANPK